MTTPERPRQRQTSPNGIHVLGYRDVGCTIQPPTFNQRALALAKRYLVPVEMRGPLMAVAAGKIQKQAFDLDARRLLKQWL